MILNFPTSYSEFPCSKVEISWNDQLRQQNNAKVKS